MTNEVMVNLIKAIFTLLGVLITYVIIPYIKSKTSKQNRENIVFWAKIAVSTAEQIYTAKGSGKDKKQYVADFIKNNTGVKLTDDELNVIIESAVYELNLAKERFIE